MLKRCRRQMRGEPWLKVVPDMRQALVGESSQLYRPWRPGRASSTAATHDKAIVGFPVTSKFMFLLAVRVDFWMIPSVSMMSCGGKTSCPSLFILALLTVLTCVILLIKKFYFSYVAILASKTSRYAFMSVAWEVIAC